MGCFLACFGFSKKRRRKSSKKSKRGDQISHGSYQPLDSSVPSDLDIAVNPICTSSEFREKPKERPSCRIRKKVTFNLDVKTYEPIPTYYNLLEWDEEEEKGSKCHQTAQGRENLGSFPSNHRYHNCRDSYDEANEMAYDELDLHDDDNDDYENDNDDIIEDEYFADNDIVRNQSQEEVSWQLASSYTKPKTRLSWTQLTKDKLSCASNVRELEPFELHQNALDRSQRVRSVLNPIENLRQWKAAKARVAPPEHQRKENIESKEKPPPQFSLKSIMDPSPFPNQSWSKPVMQEIAVDSSLSNWLVLPKFNRGETKIRCS
ncbi:hypothetical protein CJ030_MR3G001194 [Morella rubra]|uniref:Protein JASON n=1 Tax=Morella rubra TaxID=262757 RepID=A0A6A1W352_9ROSI|nr:hypothetical protein CJ030_MR3G001194 [Morella rubra]